MPFQQGEFGRVAEKTKIHWFDKVLTFIMLLMLVMMFVLFGQARHTQKTQQDGIVRGYTNRAVTCDLAKAIGSSEPANCADPAIKPYRDPNLVPASTAGARASEKTLRAVCAALQEVNSPDAKSICEEK